MKRRVPERVWRLRATASTTVMDMPTPRVILLGWLGGLGSLLWLGLNSVLSPDWGPPGSTSYLGYETINRLWAPCFALMLCGFVGLYQRYLLRTARLGRVGFRLAAAGLVVMIAGNVAEFWFFSELPYGTLNARAWAWISVLLGILALMIGATLLGLAGLREHTLPLWGRVTFALVPVVFVVLFFAQLIEAAWMALAVLGLAASAMASWPAGAAGATKGSL